MSREKINHYNKIVLAIFLLIQPIFNIIRTRVVYDIQLFGLSFFESVNVFLLGVSLILTFIVNYKNKKFLRTFMIFSFTFVLYSIFHYINIMKFDLSIYEFAEPSFFVETYYLIITFAVPVLYCILLIYSNFSKNEILKLIKILVFIITNVIVISDILSISYTAYGEDDVIADSIFKWFNFKNTGYYSYYKITSRGLFYSANQLSAMLFMMAPIIMYSAYENKKKFDYYLLFMISLSMLMIGTKTASIGIILIYLMFIILWIFFRVIKKESKKITSIIIMFVITICIFCYSPLSHNLRYRINGGTAMSSLQQIEKNNSSATKEQKEILDQYNNFKKLKCEDLDASNKNKFKTFLTKNLSFMGIPNYIVNSYSVSKHIDFWCEYVTHNKSSDFRNLKTSILANIYNENNNEYDKWLGMGHTLNYIYTESDYTYQFYHYGIIGMVVLFGFYIYYIILYLYRILKNRKHDFNFKNIISISGPILIFGVAYFSGHVLERLFPLVVLSLLISYNLITKEEDESNKRVLFISSTGGHLNELLQLKDLFKKYDSYLITEKTKSNLSLKEDNKNVYFLIYGTKDHKLTYIFKFLFNCFISLYLFAKIRPKVIVTTGTHTAVPMCYIGKLFGSKIIYIETFANSKTKTLAGKLVYPIASTFIVQWKDMLKLYPKAIYGGWIY